MGTNTFLDLALFYVSRDWHVFPCQPREKTPLVKWADEATIDPNRLSEWWAKWPAANVGIMTGKQSGIVVLDVDAGHGGNESLMALIVEHGKLPDTPQSLTGGGGCHYLFAHPSIEIHNSASKLAPGLDIRGDGGYIVAPPSIHPSGKRYEWELSSLPSKIPLAPMPEWMIAKLRETQPQIAAALSDPKAPLYSVGQRNAAMTSLAGSMRRRGMGEEAIIRALIAENAEKCSPPLSADEITRITASVCRYAPKTPPEPTPESQRQRVEVEWLFAASAYGAPFVALDECGWLLPDMLIEPKVRNFWGRLTNCRDALQAATESGALTDLINYRSRDGHLATREYAAQIARYGYLNRVGDLASDLSCMIAQGDVPAVQEILAAMSGEIPALGREPVSAWDGLAAFLGLIGNPDERVIKTGIAPLDNAIGGLERQTSTVIAGRPGMGKTTIGWQIARNVAATHKRVLFFSLEMSVANLWGKAACGVAEVRWRDFLAGKLPESVMNKIVNQIVPSLMETYGDWLLIDDGINTTDTIWQMTINKKPDLIVIDHLRLVADKGDNETRRLGVVSQRIKDLAKRSNCAALSLAQLNRLSEQRGSDNKRPQLTDLRDSGQIEENADDVIMLYREDYYKTSESPSRYSPTELLVRKARNDSGQQCVNLIYDLAQQWFYKPEDVGLTTKNVKLNREIIDYAH